MIRGLKMEYQGSVVSHITGLGVSNFCEVGNQGFLSIHLAIDGKLKKRKEVILICEVIYIHK